MSYSYRNDLSSRIQTSATSAAPSRNKYPSHTNNSSTYGTSSSRAIPPTYPRSTLSSPFTSTSSMNGSRPATVLKPVMARSRQAISSASRMQVQPQQPHQPLVHQSPMTHTRIMSSALSSKTSLPHMYASNHKSSPPTVMVTTSMSSYAYSNPAPREARRIQKLTTAVGSGSSERVPAAPLVPMPRNPSPRSRHVHSDPYQIKTTSPQIATVNTTSYPSRYLHTSPYNPNNQIPSHYITDDRISNDTRPMESTLQKLSLSSDTAEAVAIIPPKINTNGRDSKTIHPQIADIMSLPTAPSIPLETFVLSPSSTARAAMGLTNLGNTCFMNSILQCLFSMNPLMGYFLSSTYRQEVEAGSKDRQLANAFGELVQDAMRLSSSSTPLTPRNLKRGIERKAPQFSGYDQHDAHELLRCLLDGLAEDLKRPASKSTKATFKDADIDTLTPAQRSLFCWNWYKLRNDSIILDVFGGQLESTITCLGSGCGYQSTTFETFLDLSVPVKSTQGKVFKSLQEGLEAYFADEMLGDLYGCDGCKTRQHAKKTYRLIRAPEILVIQLKRFSFSVYSNRIEGKISSPIEYPISGLEMSSFVNNKLLSGRDTGCVYDLIAMSNHSGGLGGGHYTATTRNFDDGQWYNKNDSYASRIGNSAGQSSEAYILFYQRRGT